MKNIKEALLEIIVRAGNYAKSERPNLKTDEIKYKFPNNRGAVTKIDLAVDAMIRNFITEQFPDHSIVSEENESVDNGGKIIWIIDPIDGTSNFIKKDNKNYCVSIGIASGEELVMGAIYAPELNELYFSDGQDVLLNGILLKNVGERPAVCFGREDKITNPRAKSLFPDCKKFSTKSAALDLAYIATGRGRAGVMEGVMIWDVAAGIVMVRAMGAQVLNIDGEPFKLSDHTLIITIK